jgi:hypothetical protein
MLARLETMVLMAGMERRYGNPEQIASAVDLIVQHRDCGRQPKITHLTEIQGWKRRHYVADIFVYEQNGCDENGKVIAASSPPHQAQVFEKLSATGSRYRTRYSGLNRAGRCCC